MSFLESCYTQKRFGFGFVKFISTSTEPDLYQNLMEPEHCKKPNLGTITVEGQTEETEACDAWWRRESPSCSRRRRRRRASPPSCPARSRRGGWCSDAAASATYNSNTRPYNSTTRPYNITTRPYNITTRPYNNTTRP